jgi:hypothetical protein
MYNKKIDNLDVCIINNISLNIDNTQKMSESEFILINYPQPHISISKFITNNKISEYNNDVVSCSDTYNTKSFLDCASVRSDPTYNTKSFLDCASVRSDPTYNTKEILDCASDILIIDDRQYEVITDEPLARKRFDNTNYIPISKSSSYQDLSKLEFNNLDDLDNLDDWDDKELMADYILDTQYLIPFTPPTVEENFYKNFYEKLELDEVAKSSNYDNECFCHYCKNYLVLPQFEILNFLDSHFTLNKNSKYLILVFRLCPEIFSDCDILTNKYLKKYIMNYLNLYNLIYDSTENFKNIVINQYFSKISNSFNSHIYEILFHQSNLKYIDYVKCDSCKNYMCPKHTYLSNCYFAKCKCCNTKSWTICGWCKPGFNEEIACKYLHQYAT